MRIVGGMWRGRPIDAPEGRGTRPTTDRMRETLASMILSAEELDLGGVSVLDAFAGSGAVGLELLSRGASSCTFCERDRRAATLVRANCQRLGAHKDSWRVVTGDVTRTVSRGLWGAPFRVVYLDPPYAMDASVVAGLVEALRTSGQLEAGCLVVYERAPEAEELSLTGFERLRSRVVASSCVDLLRMQG